MENKRMYYFDGKDITEGMGYTNYDGKKFDQNFDYLNATEIFKKSNMSQAGNETINKNIASSVNFQNLMMSGEYGGEHDENNLQNTRIVERSFETSQNIPEHLITMLKDHFYRTKGYLENKPNVLMDFVLEFRSFLKKGLKVPNKISPLLIYADQDIYYTLQQNYNSLLLSVNKSNTKNNNTVTSNQFKTKFSTDTLKRLYPKHKDDSELIKSKSNLNGPVNLAKMVEWLVECYYQDRRELTNEEDRLFDYWLLLEDRDNKGLKWPMGEKNFEVHLKEFFSDEKVILRLMKSFQNICGYECFHPRPLHDYWVKQINPTEKYKKGLNKYDSESLYHLLEDYFYKRKLDKQKSEEKMIESTKKEDDKISQKYKVDKEDYKKILKKFALLAKPKDKWRTGREMINLKRNFRYDNIIKKMIKLEFESNKVFKYPEEYALYNDEEMRKVIFKNSLEKSFKPNENEEKIKEMLSRAKNTDDYKRREEEYELERILKEDKALERYMKKMCIKYFRLTKTRLTNGVVSINKFLTDMYYFMLKYHSASTKRRFPKMRNYGRKKKSRFNNYPSELKIYFFNLYRRLGVSQDGAKFIFARNDNMPFWAPALSNNCKIHKNNCPVYCKNNTHNNIIYDQRSKNFNFLYNLEDTKLADDERLNLWKRKDGDIMDRKSKIFLCLSEAEHCTFEPKINKEPGRFQEDNLTKRVSNKAWVQQMGENFSGRFPLVFKEGVFKKACVLFQQGKFTETTQLLSTAFNLDAIRAKFDPKYEAVYKKKQEEQRKQGNEPHSNDVMQMISRDERKKEIDPDNFDLPKSLLICQDIFSMLLEIDAYKNDRKKNLKKLKEEIKVIEDSKKQNNITEINTNISNMASTNANTVKDPHKISFIKDKYFKYFKTIMCPLK